MSEYDSSIIFMPLNEAQLYFNQPDSVTVLEVVLDSPDEVGQLAPKIVTAGGSSIYVSDWRQRNATFFTALQVERNVMFLILALIVLVAALNIISGLIMLVKDKGHDIAILRTMGATRGAIMRIFFITGASIGIVGTLAGFVLGVLVCANIERMRELIGWLTDTELFAPELYYLIAAAGRDGHGRDRLRRHHGAGPLDPRHALSLLEGLSARSGRSAALRVGPGGGQPQQPAPVLRLERLERGYTQGNRRIDVLERGLSLVLSGRGRGAARPVWRRQIDAAAYRRPAGAARRGPC